MQPAGLGREKERAAGWRGFWWNRFGTVSQGPARTGSGFCRPVSSWAGTGESRHPWVHPAKGRRESPLPVGGGHAPATLNSAGPPVGREPHARLGSAPSPGLVPYPQKVAQGLSLEEGDGPQACSEGPGAVLFSRPHLCQDAHTSESPPSLTGGGEGPRRGREGD